MLNTPRTVVAASGCGAADLACAHARSARSKTPVLRSKWTRAGKQGLAVDHLGSAGAEPSPNCRRRSLIGAASSSAAHLLRHGVAASLVWVRLQCSEGMRTRTCGPQRCAEAPPLPSCSVHKNSAGSAQRSRNAETAAAAECLGARALGTRQQARQQVLHQRTLAVALHNPSRPSQPASTEHLTARG